MLICECGEIIKSGTFRVFIRTSAGPSTSTIGHTKCGFIFNFIDDKMPKKYSSRKELKVKAMRFVEKNKMQIGDAGKFMVEVDRLKSVGSMPDIEILITAFQKL